MEPVLYSCLPPSLLFSVCEVKETVKSRTRPHENAPSENFKSLELILLKCSAERVPDVLLCVEACGNSLAGLRSTTLEVGAISLAAR